MAVKVRVWPSYDLDATLAPSFVRALFLERDGEYVKIAGWKRGAVIRQEGLHVVGEGCGVEELKLWSGTWLDRKLLEEHAPALARAWPQLGLSVSPWDHHLIFVAVFLSRATSWEGNVLRWCRALFSKADTIEELLKLDFTAVGRSFQLKQVKRALEEYARIVDEVAGAAVDPWKVRRMLLAIKYVGPKLADAYLLFTGIDPGAAPVDRHAVRMAKRLGLPFKQGFPVKRLCAVYACEECPAFRCCLRSLMTLKFKEAAGWVQTAFYMHDREYCAPRLCTTCPLASVCRKA